MRLKNVCVLLVTALALLAGCAAAPAASQGNAAASAPESAAAEPAEPEESEPAPPAPEEPEEEKPDATLLYQGHGSLRITTPEGKVIYIDPYAGEGYDLPADLILITHGHYDHVAVERIDAQNPGCRTITYAEALKDGEYGVFDLEYVTVEAVQAGNNPNHDINVCVGYVLTLSDGTGIYVSGDTSRTGQMASLAERALDYAFFCCDGQFNMDMDEAAECAALVGAGHSIPYHIAPGKDFDAERAEMFAAENRLILAAGEEIIL